MANTAVRFRGSRRKARPQAGLAGDAVCVRQTAPGLFEAERVSRAEARLYLGVGWEPTGLSLVTQASPFLSAFLRQGMWPAWRSAPTGVPQPWPSASWRPCGGSSRLPMTPRTSVLPPGRTLFSNSVCNPRLRSLLACVAL